MTDIMNNDMIDIIEQNGYENMTRMINEGL